MIIRRLSAAYRASAFTLIELLVVIAIIAILAALILQTAGFVNKKGATSRAEAEIAAISTALESYKIDNGEYPTNSYGYSNNVLLYQALMTSNTNLNPLNKNYLSLPKGSVASGGIIDPFGQPYQYRTGSDATNNGSNFFDLWSTAGTTNTSAWIKNW